MSEILKDYKINPNFLLEEYSEEASKDIGFTHILGNKNRKESYETIQSKYF